MPHAIARLSFLQLGFTAGLDFNYITYEKASMDTAAFVSMIIILAFGIYALGEIVLALVYRNYIHRNEFDTNVPDTTNMNANPLFALGMFISGP